MTYYTNPMNAGRPENPNKKKALSCSLPPEQIQWLRETASKLQISINQLISAAIGLAQAKLAAGNAPKEPNEEIFIPLYSGE